MWTENKYKIISKSVFENNGYSIVPIRYEDRIKIMHWRNEQVYHLRQSKILTPIDQDRYFEHVVSKLFEEEKPDQILFSYLEGERCIGYGGLVRINWSDKHAEISFIMETSLESESFSMHWTNFLQLLGQVAFHELGFYKLFTYAFDLRPRLYDVLVSSGFIKEAVLKDHCLFQDRYVDVIIHSKYFNDLFMRPANFFDTELSFKWANDPVVRNYSFNKTEIRWEEHHRWFTSKLLDPFCRYYILQNKGLNIGSIRFDVDESGSAKISYLVDPVFHGQGYGRLILQMGQEKVIEEMPEIKNVVGYVMKENAASISIFEKMGFEANNDDGNLVFVKEYGK